MKMTKEALLLVVKAARMSEAVADSARRMIAVATGETYADMVAGFLKDALYEMCGEHLTVEQDFEQDSVIPKLIVSDKTDGEVADIIWGMAEKNADPVMPGPNLISRGEFNRMFEKSGGYRHSPEGEWL